MFLKAPRILFDRTVLAGSVQPKERQPGWGRHALRPEPPAMAREAQPCPNGKPVAPVPSVNTMGTLPVLLPGLGNPGKVNKPPWTMPAPCSGLPEAQLFGKAHPVLHTQKTLPV